MDLLWVFALITVIQTWLIDDIVRKILFIGLSIFSSSSKTFYLHFGTYNSSIPYMTSIITITYILIFGVPLFFLLLMIIVPSHNDYSSLPQDYSSLPFFMNFYIFRKYFFSTQSLKINFVHCVEVRELIFYAILTAYQR